LAKAVEAREVDTEGHNQRLAAWAEAIARELGCSEAEVQAVYWAAWLHDIGVISVPDRILRKPGPLSEEEWEVVRRHPEVGAEIVAPVKKLAAVIPLIRAHQERYDGSGYPEGLKGEAIPLGARILAVADAYGAMIEGRVYRQAHPPEEAVAELERLKGVQFDPGVVEAFLKCLAGGIEVCGEHTPTSGNSILEQAAESLRRMEVSWRDDGTQAVSKPP